MERNNKNLRQNRPLKLQIIRINHPRCSWLNGIPQPLNLLRGSQAELIRGFVHIYPQRSCRTQFDIRRLVINRSGPQPFQERCVDLDCCYGGIASTINEGKFLCTLWLPNIDEQRSFSARARRNYRDCSISLNPWSESGIVDPIQGDSLSTVCGNKQPLHHTDICGIVAVSLVQSRYTAPTPQTRLTPPPSSPPQTSPPSSDSPASAA